LKGGSRDDRRLLVVLGVVVGLMLYAGGGDDDSGSREYQAPAQAPAASAGSEAAEKAAREKKARERGLRGGHLPNVPVVGSRVAIWMVAQLHLLFAAFVLGRTDFRIDRRGDRLQDRDRRYDRLAHEFTKLLSVSFSLTATFGAALTFMLIILYPKFTNYLMSVFSPTFLPYVLLFFARPSSSTPTTTAGGKFHPLVHLGLGLGLNSWARDHVHRQLLGSRS
jgi:hypothetical protein